MILNIFLPSSVQLSGINYTCNVVNHHHYFQNASSPQIETVTIKQ